MSEPEYKADDVLVSTLVAMHEATAKALAARKEHLRAHDDRLRATWRLAMAGWAMALVTAVLHIVDKLT